MKLGHIQQSSNLEEDTVENQDHAVVQTILCIHVDVDPKNHEQPAIDIMISEGFGEKDEGENNTDSFAECSNCYCTESTKLSNKTQNDLEIFD